MDAHDKAILWSSAEANYRTPKDCYETLNAEFSFLIDAAADVTSALCHWWMGPGSWTGAEDALAADWNALIGRAQDGSGQRAIFINPPFSKTLLNAYNTGRIKVDGEWVPHEKNPLKARAYDIANWANKCWTESQKGATIVGIFPFAPQTEWYRQYILGHLLTPNGPTLWMGHAAREERRLPHRISFLQPDGTPTGNAGVNSVIVVWKPNYGIVGPYQPHSFYWSYRQEAA